MRLIDGDALMRKFKTASPMAVDGRARQIVEDMPTIEERKTGKWIDKSGGIEGAWNYCSICGEQAIDLYDFCPNCGADMRGERYGKAD